MPLVRYFLFWCDNYFLPIYFIFTSIFLSLLRYFFIRWDFFLFLVRYFHFWLDIFLFCNIFSLLVRHFLCSDIFLFCWDIFFGEIFSFLVIYFLFLVGSFFPCWDICLYGKIFLVFEMWVPQLLDITCLHSLSFSTEIKSNLQPTRASVPRI